MKRKVFLVVGLCLLGLLVFVAGIPVGKRAYQEYREHVPYRYISLKRIPEDNGIPRLYINTKTGIMVKTKEHYVDADMAVYVGGEKDKAWEVRIKGHGNTTWDKPKKAYLLRFAKPVSLMGYPAAEKWVLLNPYNDKSLIRNDLAYHLGQEIFTNLHWTPHLTDVEVVMNGKFLGVYQLAEKIDLGTGKGRVEVAPGGTLMEFHKQEDYTITTSRGVRMISKDPKKNVPSKDFEHWKQVVQDFEDRIYNDDFGSYDEVFDTPSFIDWYLVNEFTKNHDVEYGGSTYWYYDPADDMLHFGPIWDFDISCGNIHYDDCDNPEGFYANRFVYASRLLEDPAFVQRVKDRWNEIKEPLLAETRAYVPEHVAFLAKATEWNYKVWKTLDVDIWPHAHAGETYEEQIAYLVDWLEKRYTWMDAAINAL